MAIFYFFLFILGAFCQFIFYPIKISCTYSNRQTEKRETAGRTVKWLMRWRRFHIYQCHLVSSDTLGGVFICRVSLSRTYISVKSQVSLKTTPMFLSPVTFPFPRFAPICLPSKSVSVIPGLLPHWTPLLTPLKRPHKVRCS